MTEQRKEAPLRVRFALEHERVRVMTQTEPARE